MRAHPISGMARINLTFRRLDPQSAERAPRCKCGQRAVLKVGWLVWPTVLRSTDTSTCGVADQRHPVLNIDSLTRPILLLDD